jgi:lipopolysaccharide heptosyltransferase II
MNKNINNIAIFRTDRIGEVLLSSVAVDAIKEKHPSSKIFFITSDYAKPLLEDRDDIYEIITFDTINKGKSFLEAINLAKKLYDRRIDTALVLNPHKMIHLACFLAGVTNRIGYNRKLGILLNKKIEDEREKGIKHEIEYTKDLLKFLDIEKDKHSPRIPANAEAEKKISGIILDKQIALNKPVIVIHPGSSNPAKMWARDNYADLICKIKKEIESTVCVIGSSAENDLCEDIIQKSKSDVLNFAGELNIKELVSLIRHANLFIGNDAGPMHIASSVNVAVIAIFGRNIPGVSPVRWGPHGDDDIVFHNDPGCRPCQDTLCPYEFQCLTAISSDMVLNAVKKKIKT